MIGDLKIIPPTLLHDPWYATCSYFRAGEFLRKDDHSYSNTLHSLLKDNPVPFFTDGESIGDILESIDVTSPTDRSLKKLYDPQTYLNNSI